MGLFKKKPETEIPQEQYGVENDVMYAEVFGTTGIVSDGSLDQEEYEDKLFLNALDYCASPEQNYLSNIQRGTMSKDGFFKVMKTHFQDEGEDDIVIDRILTRLEKYIWGYYILEDYIDDDSISDIKVLDENKIRIKRHGVRMGADMKFFDAKDYQRFVDIICSRNKIMLSDINAIQTFTDSTNNPNARLRFNLTSGYINSSGKPVIHIRKIPKRKRTLEDLVRLEMIPEELLPYLKEKAKHSPGILFTGKGASGKTTLMNAMIEEIPLDKSGCIIQENDELFTDHPDMMVQHVVQNRGESRIQYALKDLAINGLLTDLDYFIIGEIKGGEAAYFMNAAYTGHQCWATGHGVNSQEAINKIVDYVKYETDYPRTDILRMLRFMNCVIFMKDFKIDEISEIVGFDPKTGELEYKLIYKRDEKDFNSDELVETLVESQHVYDDYDELMNIHVQKSNVPEIGAAAFNFNDESASNIKHESKPKRNRNKNHRK